MCSAHYGLQFLNSVFNLPKTITGRAQYTEPNLLCKYKCLLVYINLFLNLCKGDLAALGNINSLHGLLAAGPLLLSQAPSLGMPLPQNQAALNPLTCLQVTQYSKHDSKTDSLPYPAI